MCFAPVSVVGDGEVEDEIAGASSVLQVVDDLNVAVFLPDAGRDSVLRAYPVTCRVEERAQARDHPVVCLGGA